MMKNGIHPQRKNWRLLKLSALVCTWWCLVVHLSISRAESAPSSWCPTTQIPRSPSAQCSSLQHAPHTSIPSLHCVAPCSRLLQLPLALLWSQFLSPHLPCSLLGAIPDATLLHADAQKLHVFLPKEMPLYYYWASIAPRTVFHLFSPWNKIIAQS